MSLVSPASGGAYGREGLVASLADVSTWIDHRKRYWDWRRSGPPDEETRNAIWLDNKFCSDVLRLLLIDAATTDDEAQRTKNLSTLLLLADHQGVGLCGFMNDGMACCNLEVGLAALVEKTAMVFIYLNLLLALTDDDEEGKLLRPCDSFEQCGSNSLYRQGSLIHLLPRPAYMNTHSFAQMLEHVLNEHGHAVEHVLFNPLFAPRPSGRRSKWLEVDADPASPHEPDSDVRFERDVMADRQSLGEALKQMWKVLIFCDVVFCEAEQAINWEKASLDAIAELFMGKAGADRLLGEDWISYEVGREREASFPFYEIGAGTGTLP